MIESVGYELIKREGLEEGLKKGIQQGIEQGMLQEAREMVQEALLERFGIFGDPIIEAIDSLDSHRLLKELHRLAIRAKDLDEFKAGMERLTGSSA